MVLRVIINQIIDNMGTPVVVLLSRLVFVIFFAGTLGLHLAQQEIIITERISLTWTLYLLVLYWGAEKIYAAFKKRDIDLGFAFPLLVVVFGLNIVSLLIQGQEEVPVINRAEHFASFVLLTYIVWIFFLKYLPQDVWQKHPYYTAILVLAITSMAGVGNEIVELFFDQTFGTQTIGHGYDTSTDLLMNTLGAGSFLSVQLILREGGVKIVG